MSRTDRGSTAGRTSVQRPLAVLVGFLAGAGVLAACDTASGGAHSRGDVPTLVPEVEEVFRIGSLSGGRWESFSRIVDAGFDARGNLYVLDGNEARIAMVDPNGEFVRTIGWAGDGPGEFRRPQAMAVMPGGEVVISDAGHRGLLLFDAAGTFVRAIPLGDGVSAPSFLAADGNNAVVFRAGTTMMMGGGAGGPGGARMRQGGPGGAGAAGVAPIHRVSLEPGDEPQVVARAWLPPRPEPQVSGAEGGGVRMVRPVRAFEPELHLAVLPGGTVAMADSTPYRIRMVAPDGSSRLVDREIEPVRVGDRERELEKERRRRELEEGGGQAGAGIAMMGMGGAGQAPDPAQIRAMREAQLQDLLFWPEIQVIQALRVDGEGRLWVQRFGGIEAPGPIEVLDLDGTLAAVIPAGGIELPVAFGPDRRAAWLEHDEYDVPFVRVGRLSAVP